jgi:hypothetical protein
VLANENTLPLLRAALCDPRGWMAQRLNPGDVIVAADFKPSALFDGPSATPAVPPGGSPGGPFGGDPGGIRCPPCHARVRRRVTFVAVPLPSHYLDTVTRVHAFLARRDGGASAAAAPRNAATATNGTTAAAAAAAAAGGQAAWSAKKKHAWPFLLVIQPFTLLRPGRLSALLRAAALDPAGRVVESIAYVAGRVHDAASDPSSMGMFPRCEGRAGFRGEPTGVRGVFSHWSLLFLPLFALDCCFEPLGRQPPSSFFFFFLLFLFLKNDRCAPSCCGRWVFLGAIPAPQAGARIRRLVELGCFSGDYTFHAHPWRS